MKIYFELFATVIGFILLTKVAYNNLEPEQSIPSFKPSKAWNDRILSETGKTLGASKAFIDGELHKESIIKAQEDSRKRHESKNSAVPTATKARESAGQSWNQYVSSFSDRYTYAVMDHGGDFNYDFAVDRKAMYEVPVSDLIFEIGDQTTSEFGYDLDQLIAKPVPTRSRLDGNPSVRRALHTADIDYIERYAWLAVSEGEKFGILPSIYLAQGILESNSGRSGLAINHHNHFGERRTLVDQSCHNGSVNVPGNGSFIDYKSVWCSYRSHGLLLSGSYRYEYMTVHFPDDYVNWARGLEHAGYAGTEQDYAEKLVLLIDFYELHVLDK